MHKISGAFLVLVESASLVEWNILDSLPWNTKRLFSRGETIHKIPTHLSAKDTIYLIILNISLVFINETRDIRDPQPLDKIFEIPRYFLCSMYILEVFQTLTKFP